MMKYNTTIGFRISLGFGLLIIVIIINAMLFRQMVAHIQQAHQDVALIFDPSIRSLAELKNLVHRSQDLTKNWQSAGMDHNSGYVSELDELKNKDFQTLHKRITDLSREWSQDDRELYREITGFITDSIFAIQEIMVQSSIMAQGPGIANDSLQLYDQQLNIYFREADDGLQQMIKAFETLSREANQDVNRIFKSSGNYLLLTGLITALLALVIAIALLISLVRPIIRFRHILSDMGHGILPEQKLREGEDEMGQIGSALNSLVQGLKNLSDFSEEIGKGNFESRFEPLSDQDILGNSLIRLREDLKNAAIGDAKRKAEDERRNWASHGIARFSEILREYNNNLEELSVQIIPELVRYLDAKVGGIFLTRLEENEDKSVELAASYAYDRRKYMKKTIEPGEGLIGRCMQEGETIFLTDIPEDYIKIKSGLGEDKPRSLLIVPLKMNEVIVGVVEIASLKIFEPFQIEFAERIGSSIASTVSSLKANIRTSRLLEQTRNQPQHGGEGTDGSYPAGIDEQ